MKKKLSSGYEVNLDGLIGPTHNYSGLSYGNIASTSHFKSTAYPKEAALQGLKKMQSLMHLGLTQVVVPPQERPFLPFLRSLGFRGTDAEILSETNQINPQLLSVSCSASSMWTANAATVSPSTDSQDGKVHFTPANLTYYLHRSIEASTTSSILKKLFSHSNYFIHHPPLPSHSYFADEGAANHTRFCQHYESTGMQLFVYGSNKDFKNEKGPRKFPARQTYAASQAIARLHQLDPNHVLFAQQNPEVIDAGAFHNDVISVGNQNVFFFHEKAFLKSSQMLHSLENRMLKIGCQLIFIKVTNEQIPLQEAIHTYLFNSQLITLPDQSMALIAPKECQESDTVQTFLNMLLLQKNHPIKQILYQDVRQSMQNGGGPACLRLRVVLNQEELSNMHQDAILTEDLYKRLMEWVKKYYRERLEFKDLVDPQLLQESREALDELTQILKLGSLYHFQMK